MKKSIFLAFVALMLSIAAHAQVYNYQYEYMVDQNGHRISMNRSSLLSSEYSLKFQNGGKEFIFTVNNGERLVSCWVPMQVSMYGPSNFSSSNKGVLQDGNYAIPNFGDGLRCYKIDLSYWISTGYGFPQSKTEYCSFLFSSDRQRMFFHVGTNYAVYRQVAQRSTTTGDPFHDIGKQVEIATKNAQAGATYGGTYPTTTTPTTTSGNSNNGTLVGSFSAFGIGQGYGNVVTYSQVFSVYRDNGGYYIIDPVNHVQRHLSYNSRSSYLGYSVSNYNYWVMTSGSDISWYFRL
ncbi:MAG: hypothetical protein II551_07315 [Paludibacteraceae bacterium]|nr:hypothetical protein [Paludibacteraceae bacterium]